MKYYSLPAELLKMNVYNMVDIGRMINKNGSTIQLEDKELLLSVEELERKFNEVESSSGSTKITNTSASTPSPATVNTKISRPDVTWLRRTEYISSVKTVSNSLPNTIEDADAKALLSASMTFEQICREVSESFDDINNPKHPSKPGQIELLQSFPIYFSQNQEQDSISYSHCLFFGDNVASSNGNANENSLIFQNSDQMIATLYNPTTSSNSGTFKFYGEFDLQKSDNVKNNCVLMLPTGDDDSSARISKINSTFSLRKRRSSNSSSKLLKRKSIKVIRK